jgi:hypothetical protein
MLSLWQRLPVVVRAVLAGSTVSAAGILPWGFLVAWNQQFFMSVPWAVLPTALYLWLFDDGDVVDRNALMLVATEASVNMPTDHDPRANSLDRHEELSAADVLHTT